MIRKYNYTGRQKISRDCIKVRQSITAGIRQFEAALDIKNLGFPDEARIYIEAYFKSSFMRFSFGTVGRVIHPSKTQLTDIPITDRVLYRIKIVDESSLNGLILGYADGLTSTVGDSTGNKIPLLPVDFNELGHRVWKLEFRDEGPVLAVNTESRIEKIREIVKSDSKFMSLVYPEVVRQIAMQIVKGDTFDDQEGSQDWQMQWLKYFKNALGVSESPTRIDDLQMEIWCDEVVDAFCRKKTIINLLMI